MTEQKHTPGPWKYVETQSPCGQEWLGCGVVEGDHEFVWLEGDPEFDIPRAHLIAAAPDMFGASPRAVEMLRIAAQLIADSSAVDHSIFYDDAECDGYCVIEDCEVVADELEAAIVKAKGE